MNYNRHVSIDHSKGEDSGVPEFITIPNDCTAGQVLLNDAGTIVQWFTGDEFVQYVCVLSFEDWGVEKCPRFAYYRQYRATPYSSDYKLCADVSESYDWNLIKNP